jgi:hypothetical protein
MIVADFFWGDVLLPAIGVMGFIFSRSKAAQATGPTQKPSEITKPEPSPVAHPEIETLRAKHRVAEIAARDEGASVDHLPDGVFGFSYAPQQESPLFRKKMFQSFEVHRVAGGGVFFIGFASEKDAASLRDAGARSEISLHPEPWRDAVKVVAVPRSRVTRAKGPLRDYGNAIKLELDAGQGAR